MKVRRNLLVLNVLGLLLAVYLLLVPMPPILVEWARSAYTPPTGAPGAFGFNALWVMISALPTSVLALSGFGLVRVATRCRERHLADSFLGFACVSLWILVAVAGFSMFRRIERQVMTEAFEEERSGYAQVPFLGLGSSTNGLSSGIWLKDRSATNMNMSQVDEQCHAAFLRMLRHGAVDLSVGEKGVVILRCQG